MISLSLFISVLSLIIIAGVTEKILKPLYIKIEDKLN